MCLELLGRGFPVFLEETERGVNKKLFSLAVPVDSNMHLIPKFNHSFTNRDCLHCAILKTLYDFKEKRTHRADRQEICIFVNSKCSRGDFQNFGDV